MKYDTAWQRAAIEQLNEILNKDSDAKALIITGSLAATDIQADRWSDVDAKIILADHAMNRYVQSTEWLSPFGQLIGMEKHESELTQTLRVCMEGFHRFDLTFIPESSWQDLSRWEHNPVPPPHAVMWSKLPDIQAQIDSFSPQAEYQDVSSEEIEKIVDAFWFKASVAIAKVGRNDLLIGLHLALGLAQDCLVLQMLRRDREEKTSIHRIGGWGNDVTAHFELCHQEETDVEILNFIQRNCELFDDLTIEMLPTYSKRSFLLEPAIGLARQSLRDTKHKSSASQQG
ncbi:MAG: aminoglycoside 6-adenylyltransferase [Chloroflexota bacterium]